MNALSRREALKTSVLGSSAAALVAAYSGPSFAEPVSPGRQPAAAPNNPMAARAYVLTIVTADMGRSLHYYRDLLGFAVARQGKLSGRPAALMAPKLRIVRMCCCKPRRTVRASGA